MNQKTNYIDTFLDMLQKTHTELSKNTTEETAHETAHQTAHEPAHQTAQVGGGKRFKTVRKQNNRRLSNESGCHTKHHSTVSLIQRIRQLEKKAERYMMQFKRHAHNKTRKQRCVKQNYATNGMYRGASS